MDSLSAATAESFRLLFSGDAELWIIILTSFSTVGGLAPMILETDLQAKFLIPMALALAAGVAFATVLTLVLIPSLLVILNDIRRLVYKLGHNNWPSREEVEPAIGRQPHGEDTDGASTTPDESAVLTRLN